MFETNCVDQQQFDLHLKSATHVSQIKRYESYYEANKDREACTIIDSNNKFVFKNNQLLTENASEEQISLSESCKKTNLNVLLSQLLDRNIPVLDNLFTQTLLTQNKNKQQIGLLETNVVKCEPQIQELAKKSERFNQLEIPECLEKFPLDKVMFKRETCAVGCLKEANVTFYKHTGGNYCVDSNNNNASNQTTDEMSCITWQRVIKAFETCQNNMQIMVPMFQTETKLIN